MRKMTGSSVSSVPGGSADENHVVGHYFSEEPKISISPLISDLASWEPFDRDRLIQNLGGDAAVLLMVPVWETELGGNRLQVARVLSKFMPVILVQPAELDRGQEATLKPDRRLDNCWVLRTCYAAGPLDADLEEIARHVHDIHWAVSQFAARRPIYWLFNPNLASLFLELDHGPRLFHATEDWYRLPRPEGTYLDLKALAAAAGVADLVVAVSRGVADGLRENVVGIEPLIETNGCNYHSFALATAERTLLRDLRTRCAKIAVFCGTIDGRLRYDLLARLLQSRPSLGLAMIGPVGTLLPEDSEVIKGLRLHPRVVFTGALPELEVASVYKASDVGLIPYKALPHIIVSQFSSKLLEMAAAGLPVVTTRMDSSRGVTEAIRVCDSDAEFLAVASLLSRKTLTRSEKKGLDSIARANDYTVKFTRVLQRLATQANGKHSRSPVPSRLTREIGNEVRRLLQAKRASASARFPEARAGMLKATRGLRRLLGIQHVTARKALGALGETLAGMGSHAAAIRFMYASLEPKATLTPSYRDWRVSLCLSLASSLREVRQTVLRTQVLQAAWSDSVVPTFHAGYSQNIGMEYAEALLECGKIEVACDVLSDVDKRDRGLQRDDGVAVRLAALQQLLKASKVRLPK